MDDTAQPKKIPTPCECPLCRGQTTVGKLQENLKEFRLFGFSTQEIKTMIDYAKENGYGQG